MNSKFHSSELSEKLLVQAFPFHLVVALSGTILSCGKPLARKIQLEESSVSDFFEHFTIQHPAGITCAEQFEDQEDKLFLIASRHNSDLLLRGQLIADSEKRYFTFLDISLDHGY